MAFPWGFLSPRLCSYIPVSTPHLPVLTNVLSLTKTLSQQPLSLQISYLNRLGRNYRCLPWCLPHPIHFSGISKACFLISGKEFPQKAKSKTMCYTYSEQRAVLTYIGHSVIVRWVERTPFQKTELRVRGIHRTVSGLEQAPSRYSLNEWIKKAHPLPANLVTILYVFFSLLFSLYYKYPSRQCVLFFYQMLAQIQSSFTVDCFASASSFRALFSA